MTDQDWEVVAIGTQAKLERLETEVADLLNRVIDAEAALDVYDPYENSVYRDDYPTKMAQELSKADSS